MSDLFLSLEAILSFNAYLVYSEYLIFLLNQTLINLGLLSFIFGTYSIGHAEFDILDLLKQGVNRL